MYWRAWPPATAPLRTAEVAPASKLIRSGPGTGVAVGAGPPVSSTSSVKLVLTGAAMVIK